MRELFRGKSIRLTAPYADDAEVMAGWYEDSEYMRMVDTDVAFPKTVEALEEELLLLPPRNTLYRFQVRELKSDLLIGFVALHSIEWSNQTGVLAVGIGNREHRGRGYGSEAVSLLLQYAFCELNLHRVGLDVIAYNDVAIRLYERAGFAVEGRLRECIFRDGKRYDRVYMGITRQEWFERQ